MGFKYSTPESKEGEFFIIKYVEPGKAMDEAGLMIHDQLTLFSVNELYRLLIGNQCQEVSIIVRRKDEEHTIIIKVPEMELFLQRLSFLI